MSTPLKTPRLPAAAKEFNVGLQTIVDFLNSKGYDVTASPTTKLTAEMYTALEGEFAQDRLAKQRSEEIVLVKGGMEQKKEKEEAPARPRKSGKAAPEAPVEAQASTPASTPAPPPAAQPTPAEAPAPQPEPAPEKAPEPEIQEVPQPEVTPSAQPEPEVQPEPAPVPAAQPEETPQPAETPEAPAETPAAPRVDGPHVIGRIDLDAIAQSARPKKSAKKAAAPKAEAPKKAAVPKKEKEESVSPKAKPEPKPAPQAVTPPPAAPPATPVVTATVETPEEAKPEHIEMKAPQLSGPKIIGKIQLPVRESGRGDSKEKRQRQRIPVQRRPENRGGGAQQGGAQRGPGQNTGPNRGQRRGNQPAGEVDQKEIQKKIQETQARLAGNTRGRGQKGKYRRDKREQAAERRAAENIGEGNTLQVTEFISVSELANMMDVSFADVIAKCMNLGIMVSINQRLDAEVIELVASEFGYEVEFINLDQQNDADAEEEDDDDESKIGRAPIVTIMGHVDHGKTSLLDYIRNATVVAGEAGGITQHIGAYQVQLPSGKRIAFLDTPGHEAFTAMRARGAKVADIAVIVIAADDAIMPQTREAISHAQAAGLPMVFAINKIDKESANPEKIREQLSAMNILVEEWGGKFQSQEISAKKGINVDQLLEKLLLESELLELKANPDRNASGSVIEASLDKGRGYVSTILVQNGTLKQGEMLVCGQYYGRVKAMLNERGQRVTTAGPSTPVQVLGLNGAPQAGEKFKVYEDENEAKNVATHRAQILREQGIRARKHLTLDEIGRRLALGNFKELPVIIKGDVDGSVEALSDSLQKLSTEEVAVNVVHKGVGQITESDILLASASDAIILGFQVRPSAQANRLADQENIEVRFYSIIYDAINDIKSAMEGLLAPTVEKKIVANVEVREVFKISGVGTIAGAYVLDGKMTRNTRINLIRDGIVTFTGELASLRRFKDDVKEVNAGYECGISIKNYNDIRVGDIIEGYEEVEIKRTLS